MQAVTVEEDDDLREGVIGVVADEEGRWRGGFFCHDDGGGVS